MKNKSAKVGWKKAKLVGCLKTSSPVEPNMPERNIPLALFRPARYAPVGCRSRAACQRRARREAA